LVINSWFSKNSRLFDFMENSLVLYRKYRPQRFSEFVGQEHIVKTLTNEIAAGRIAHAYIFAGPRGSGKTTMARLLAKSLNCQNRKEGEFEPCNKCSSCQEISQGNSLDLIEIDAASHRGIDEIRELKDGIKFSPVKEKYKVFIIDEAHQLTKEAANALLKTLEEPPPYAVFILATTEIHKMIPTIISRCQRFDFRKLSLSEIIKKLEFISKKEGIQVDEALLKIIALNSDGSIRDAETILDQVFSFGRFLGKPENKKIEIGDVKKMLGLTEFSLISEFVDFISKKEAPKAIELLNKAIERGTDPQDFAKALVRYLRQLLILKIKPDIDNEIIIGLAREEQKKSLEQVKTFTIKEIQKALVLFLEAGNKIKYSSIPQLPLELAVVDFLEINGKDN